MSNAKTLQRDTRTPLHFFWRRGLFLAALLAIPLYGQQTDVRQFDAFVGYGLLDSPHIGLSENGVAAQIGYRPKTWLTVGFDYTFAQGNLSLTPPLLLPALQQTLGGQLGQLAAADAPTQLFADDSDEFKHPNLCRRPRACQCGISAT